MEEAGLEIVVDPSAVSEGTVVLRLIGFVDPATAPGLRTAAAGAIDEHEPKQLVLDLAAVTFMDSSGVRVILELHHRLGERGGSLVLADVPSMPRRVLEVSGLIDELVLTESE